MKHADIHILEGGVGKHLQFTSMLDDLTADKKINIMTPWPEIFKHDSRVAHSCVLHIPPLHDHTHTFFKNYWNVYCHEPYRSNFLKGDCHIVDYWRQMYELPDVDDKRPNFQVNQQREKILERDILKLGKFILVQFTGGQAVKTNNYDTENAGKNYNQGQEVVNLLREQLPNINIIVFGHDNEQEPLLNTMAFNNFGGNPKFVDKVDFMILAKYCVSFITIDSALQHMCSNKPFNKKGVVLWGTSKPEMFGYNQNINLISDYPYCVEIDPKTIVDTFLNQEMA
jgi:ADP-heptose:LPS heptosyltransferase